MPIVGLNFKSINAKIDDKKIKSDLEISSVPRVENVEKRDVKFAGMTEAVVISFSFKTKYEPEVAEISFTGEVVYQTDDPKSLVKYWKDNKKLDEKTTVEVFNAIFRRCLSKAIAIADDLRLPPPLTFPVVIPKQKESENKK